MAVNRLCLASFWTRTSKNDGRKFLSGKLDKRDGTAALEYLRDNPEASVLIFPNDRRDNDRAPEYRAFIIIIDQPAADSGGGNAAGGGRSGGGFPWER